MAPAACFEMQTYIIDDVMKKIMGVFTGTNPGYKG